MNKKKKANLNRGGELRGIICGLITNVTLLIIMAILLEKEKINIENSDWYLIGINIISALAIGITAKTSKNYKSINAITAGAVYAGLLIATGLIINKNEIEFIELIRIILISIIMSFAGSKVNLFKSNKRFH